MVGMVGIVGGMADTGFCQSALILCSTKFSLKKPSVLCEHCEVEMHPSILFQPSGLWSEVSRVRFPNFQKQVVIVITDRSVMEC